MMRGLHFREEKVAEVAKRGFAKIAAGLALVSALAGCSASSPYTYPAHSQYRMSVSPSRRMEHHMTTAPTITVQGQEAKAVDLMLPLSRMMERDRRFMEIPQDGPRVIQDEQATMSGRERMFLRMLRVERYQNDSGRAGTFVSDAGFAFSQFLMDNGTFMAQMVIRNRAVDFSRGFDAANFMSLVSPRVDFIDGVLITQGLFGTYSVFMVPVGSDGQPIGRVSQGQLAFGITYDHQRQEAVGGLVVLRDP